MCFIFARQPSVNNRYRFYCDDINPNEFHKTILQIASELKIYMEAVPLDRFIPIPDGAILVLFPLANLAILKWL